MPTEQHVNVLLADGGMGDLLCALVATDYNIRNYKHCTFNVWVPDYMLDFTKHVLTRGAVIRPYSKAKNKYNEKLPGVTTKWGKSFHTPMRTHPVDYSFHMLTDKHIYNLNEKNYLQVRPDEIDVSRFKLPEKYVVIASAAVVACKSMPPETANAIIDYLLGKGYTPVFLGRRITDVGIQDMTIEANSLNVNYQKGINLLDRTSLLESAKIMSDAKAVVGMDGGLIHLAGFTDTEIIAGFTLVSPDHIAPIRKGTQTYKFHAVVPDEDIPNRFYQTNMNFNFNEDMRDFEGWEKVLASMTPEKFIGVLDTIL